jgi:hypothetical protein
MSVLASEGLSDPVLTFFYLFLRMLHTADCNRASQQKLSKPLSFKRLVQ